MDENELLLPHQVAERYGIAVGTLSNWRREAKGPQYICLGRGRRPRIMYRLADCLEWELKNRSGEKK